MSHSPPSALFSSRSPKAMSNSAVTCLLQCHDSRGCFGACLRTFLLLATAGSATYSCLALVYCLHNVHVRFWLGDVVIICLALYVAALVPAMAMLAYKICVTAHRRNQKELHRSMMSRGGDHKDVSWRLSIKTLQFLFMLIAMLSTIAAVLSYIVVTSGMEVSSSLLLDCGKGEISSSLERTDRQLRDFASASQCSPTLPLDQCRGFAKAFPPPSPWATYTKVLETDMECGGWCQRKPPLFRPGSASDPGGEACSTALGRYVWSVGTFTGAPTLAGASLLAFLGLALHNYDGL